MDPSNEASEVQTETIETSAEPLAEGGSTKSVNPIVMGSGLAVVGCFIWALHSRSRDDLLFYSLLGGLIYVVPLLAVVLKQARAGQYRSAFTSLGGVIVLEPLLGLFMYGVAASLKDLVFWGAREVGLARSDNSFEVLIACVAIVAVFGIACGLFCLRLYWRALYGLSEATVGLLIAIGKLRAEDMHLLLSKPDLLMAILTASIYLMVRGVDNVHQGLYAEKGRRDPIATKFVEFFERHWRDIRQTNAATASSAVQSG
jgi:hypothetical protein